MQLTLFELEPIPKKLPPPRSSLWQWCKVFTKCNVCGECNSVTTPYILTREQMVAKGWVETSPDTWVSAPSPCSRHCEERLKRIKNYVAVSLD